MTLEEKNSLIEKIRSLTREVLSEMNVTTVGGASFTPGSGENYATPFAFGKASVSKELKRQGWKQVKPKKHKKLEEMKLNDIIEKELLNEVTYHQFKKDTQNRTKAEQLHKAIKEVKKKIQEINRIVEYTSRMKQELNEEGGINYWKATSNSVGQIAEMVNNLNNKIKDLNQ
jgi:hypothetical protein